MSTTPSKLDESTLNSVDEELLYEKFSLLVTSHMYAGNPATFISNNGVSFYYKADGFEGIVTRQLAGKAVWKCTDKESVIKSILHMENFIPSFESTVMRFGDPMGDVSFKIYEAFSGKGYGGIKFTDKGRVVKCIQDYKAKLRKLSTIDLCVRFKLLAMYEEFKGNPFVWVSRCNDFIQYYSDKVTVIIISTELGWVPTKINSGAELLRRREAIIHSIVEMERGDEEASYR